MASPHVAGLLAYLLSIYPSPQFDPVFDEDFNILSLTRPQRSIPASVYAVAHAVLPQWATTFLPAPEFIAPIPDKPKTLSASQLKKAVIKLASKGLLSDLPANTANLLVFNNATQS